MNFARISICDSKIFNFRGNRFSRISQIPSLLIIFPEVNSWYLQNIIRAKIIPLKVDDKNDNSC